MNRPTIILAPDSFKGALSAAEAAQAMALGLRRVWPQADLRLMPLADGGEGTLEAVLATCGGERREWPVSGADQRPVRAAYGLLQRENGTLAVLEAAQVVGLTLRPVAAVAERTSRGLGELLRHCLDEGIRQFMIGLGGTSSNDGGAGVLVALGARLLAADGRELAATPAGLADLAEVDFSGLDPRLDETRITLLSDVQNPLCGPLGASAVFGPQKGLSRKQVASFDAHLHHFATLCDSWRGEAIAQRAGAGAAGGLGYILQWLGAQNRSGAELLCELSGLDATLTEADWLLTGEGRSDAQTPLGKVAWVVAEHARRAGVPVTLLSGAVEEADLASLSAAFDGCFSIAPGPLPLTEAMTRSATLLADRAEQLARLATALQRRPARQLAGPP